VIVANDEIGNPPILGGSFAEAPPTVPAVSVTPEDGAAIKAALPASGTVRKHPNHPGIRDGDLENGIIIHEYGHGVSNRLTGGLKTMNCLSGNDQAGEGARRRPPAPRVLPVPVARLRGARIPGAPRACCDPMLAPLRTSAANKVARGPGSGRRLGELRDHVPNLGGLGP
jgi:hypothetical protein